MERGGITLQLEFVVGMVAAKESLYQTFLYSLRKQFTHIRVGTACPG